MNCWVFLIVLLLASLLLGELDHALMVFQIREKLGFDPVVAMHIGSLIDWLSTILVVVAFLVASKSSGKKSD